MKYVDYKWSARADHDNPKVIGDTDHAELNRTEGYEMLYFINSLARAWGWGNDVQLTSYQHLEDIIKTKVPTNTRTHSGIKNWIEQNYSRV